MSDRSQVVLPSASLPMSGWGAEKRRGLGKGREKQIAAQVRCCQMRLSAIITPPHTHTLTLLAIVQVDPKIKVRSKAEQETRDRQTGSAPS